VLCEQFLVQTPLVEIHKMPRVYKMARVYKMPRVYTAFFGSKDGIPPTNGFADEVQICRFVDYKKDFRLQKRFEFSVAEDGLRTGDTPHWDNNGRPLIGGLSMSNSFFESNRLVG
jgi:hypothetical protein